MLLSAIDGLEPTLTRSGYNTGALASQLNIWSSDVRTFLAGPLDADMMPVSKPRAEYREYARTSIGNVVK